MSRDSNVLVGQAGDDGRIVYSLDASVPSNCHALQDWLTPTEQQVTRGPWVVYCMARYSGYDRAFVSRVCDFARGYDKTEFGIRPFLEHAELRTWFRNDSMSVEIPDGVSPIWILLQDGRSIAVTFGVMDPTEFDEFLRRRAEDG